MIPEKLIREERLLYSLHTRDNARWVKGKREECNQFYFDVQPDYGGGVMKDDAEKVAKEIEMRYNDFLELKENSDLFRGILTEFTTACKSASPLELIKVFGEIYKKAEDALNKSK